MNKFLIFVIQCIVAMGFAVVLTRLFYGNTNILYSAGVAIILVGLAYFASFLRNRKNR